MKFERAFPRILQSIWEKYPSKGPVQVSKLEVTDAYHRSILRLYQVGAFTYVVPLAPEDDCIIICVDMVLLMGQVDSPKFLCAFSETLIYVTNDLVDTELPITYYISIYQTPSTSPDPPPTHARASPILTIIWTTSSPWRREVHNANNESLTAWFVPSSGSPPQYRENTKDS